MDAFQLCAHIPGLCVGEAPLNVFLGENQKFKREEKERRGWEGRRGKGSGWKGRKGKGRDGIEEEVMGDLGAMY